MHSSRARCGGASPRSRIGTFFTISRKSSSFSSASFSSRCSIDTSAEQHGAEQRDAGISRSFAAGASRGVWIVFRVQRGARLSIVYTWSGLGGM
eukprot:9194227-Prorocentrum_lima.AAC.1